MKNGKFEFGFKVDLFVINGMEPKVDAGRHFKDRYPDQIDPRGEPEEIEFEWNRNMKSLRDCDVIHFLYLIQLSLELHRQWVIGRNQYFASISRTDRFIDHVDGPQVISNLIKWHNKDRERNALNGAMIENQDGMSFCNILVEVGMYSFTEMMTQNASRSNLDFFIYCLRAVILVSVLKIFVDFTDFQEFELLQFGLKCCDLSVCTENLCRF